MSIAIRCNTCPNMMRAMHNTDKLSLDSWYYMYCDEDDKVYLSSNIMMW